MRAKQLAMLALAGGLIGGNAISGAAAQSWPAKPYGSSRQRAPAATSLFGPMQRASRSDGESRSSSRTVPAQTESWLSMP